MSWHVAARERWYPTHAWVGSFRQGRYVLVQWWPTEGSWPGVGIVWGERRLVVGLRKRGAVLRG